VLREWIRRRPLEHGEQRIVAELTGVSARTLRKWTRGDAPPRPRGRPKTSPARRLAARRLVCREWRRQGTSAGVKPVAAALCGCVPRWLVRDLLRAIKGLHRARRRRRETEHRLSVEVGRRDVM